MTDEFAETDEWPAPQGWMRHQAENGLVPPIPATYTPASDRVVWRDRGERIAALEAENEKLRDVAGGRVLHLFLGGCPDELDGFDRRDSNCPACRALLSPSPAATTGEAHSACPRTVEYGLIRYACGIDVAVKTPNAYEVHVAMAAKMNADPAPVSSGETAPCPSCMHEHGRERWPLCLCPCNRPAPVVTPSAEGSE